MGRLTYVNRKIEGTKLAQVVTRDIIKRTFPNISYKAALRDPVVDFDISNKRIGDVGLDGISKALVTAIGQTDPGRALILEEVSLQNNNFSVAGVVAFASVIRLCSSEIRNLDLSGNDIEIRTSEQSLAWETFLQSFAQCTSLRRLDLSGNKLGRRGFEILSKVWAAEVGVLVCQETGSARSCGLQSIPYLCLAETGLDDLGSTYLSYILESHKVLHDLLPLVPQARAGAQTHQLEALDEIEGCNGLIWKSNSGMGSLGVRVLELAELVRQNRKDLQDQDVLGARLIEAVSQMDISGSPKSINESRSREDSLISIDESFHISSSHNASDIMRARSRIQLDALKDGGLAQSELWSTAFRLSRYSRIILTRPRNHAHSSDFSTYASSLSGAAPNANPQQPQTWPTLSRKIPPSRTPARVLKIAKSENTHRRALSQGNPNLSLSMKNHSTKPTVILDTPKTTNIAFRRKLKKGRNLVEELSVEVKAHYASAYRADLPAGFHEDIWIHIIAYAADANGVLSSNQITSAVRWSASRETLVGLLNLRGKHQSQQAYKALEGMDCLTYGI